ncbi:hypothetical protein [Bradyrhizobium liaoningense]|uniref:hypothetical protein n=1 Tax=Bradyrhizobium liaoningense TaxID=43992 RepID=UPI001BA77EA7|nr:hypothetical protein [Bradyrhizobium liaoningense]MBR0822709.1 hypothetical protein [Bradyrhizobium liaoningense]
MPPEAEVSYPTATQQDHDVGDRYRWWPARRQACASTAIQKPCDRQRVGTGGAPRLHRTYIGKLEADGMIHRQGDGFPLYQSGVAYLRYLRRERRQSPRSEADAAHVAAMTASFRERCNLLMLLPKGNRFIVSSLNCSILRLRRNKQF